MDFNTWKQFYEWGFCTIEQLKQAVKQGMLTTEQYKEICGEDYAPAALIAPVQPQVEQSTPKVETPVQPIQPQVETPSTTSDEKPVAEPKKEVESTQPKVEIQNSSNALEGKSVQSENNSIQSQTETTEVKPVE